MLLQLSIFATLTLTQGESQKVFRSYVLIMPYFLEH